MAVEANHGQIWAGDAEGQEHSVEDRTQWTAHVDEVRELLRPQYALGRPPGDLVEMLILLALGGPGVLAQRALAQC